MTGARVPGGTFNTGGGGEGEASERAIEGVRETVRDSLTEIDTHTHKQEHAERERLAYLDHY